MFLQLTNYALASEVTSSANLAQPSPLQSILPIVVILTVFYFFIIRPQSKKYKDQQSMLETTKIGDNVIILSGVFGKISTLNQDNTCELEIAPNVYIKVYKSTIAKNLSLEERAKKEITTKS